MCVCACVCEKRKIKRLKSTCFKNANSGEIPPNQVCNYLYSSLLQKVKGVDNLYKRQHFSIRKAVAKQHSTIGANLNMQLLIYVSLCLPLFPGFALFLVNRKPHYDCL